jgi:hypothetical protein
MIRCNIQYIYNLLTCLWLWVHFIVNIQTLSLTSSELQAFPPILWFLQGEHNLLTSLSFEWVQVYFSRSEWSTSLQDTNIMLLEPKTPSFILLKKEYINLSYFLFFFANLSGQAKVVELTFDYWCRSTVVVKYCTINCLHSSPFYRF